MKSSMKLCAIAVFSAILTACSAGGNGDLGSLKPHQEKAKGEQRTKLPKPSVIIADLNSEAGVQKLYQDILKEKDISTCSSTKGCESDLPVNSLLGAYNQSYSSYAAIRTTSTAKSENEQGESVATEATAPVNSFVALVREPTTNRAAIVDAAYTGQVSYSTQYRGNVVSRPLEMRVNQDKISGAVIDETGSGKQRPRMTFENAAIQADDKLIHFAGDVTFHREVFLDMGNSKNPEYEGDIKGIYQGAFAGKNGEEVIGNFYSNNLIKNYSIQGAFGAKRVEK